MFGGDFNINFVIKNYSEPYNAAKKLVIFVMSCIFYTAFRFKRRLNFS
jgi:hypothetical protein